LVGGAGREHGRGAEGGADRAGGDARDPAADRDGVSEGEWKFSVGVSGLAVDDRRRPEGGPARDTERDGGGQEGPVLQGFEQGPEGGPAAKRTGAGTAESCAGRLPVEGKHAVSPQ